MFFLCRLGSSEHEIADFEYPPSVLPFVVPAEGLLVASRADDGCLVGFFKQVDYVLLGLRSSVVIESLHSWCAVVEVGGQYFLGSVSQKERCESRGSIRGRPQAPKDRWYLCNPSSGVLVESVKDAWIKSLEDHAISTLDLAVSTWMSDRGPVDPDVVSIIEVR